MKQFASEGENKRHLAASTLSLKQKRKTKERQNNF